MLLAEGLERAEDGQHLVAQRAELVAQEELEVHEHLVVAGTAGVDLLADLAQLAGEQEFDLGVDVLDVGLEREVAGLDALRDAGQGGVQHGQLVRRQQADAFQHLDVRPGALHVVARQPEVQHAVVADREAVDGLGRRSAFIPKSCHINSQ